MFPIDPMWIYIFVPTVLVSILVLIRLRQEKMDKRVQSTFTEREEVRHPEKEATSKGLVEFNETQTKPKFHEEGKSEECPHYLGYLYMKRGRDST